MGQGIKKRKCLCFFFRFSITPNLSIKAHRNVHNKKAAARERRRAADAETNIAPRMFEIKGEEALNGQRFSTLDDLEKFGGDEAVSERKRKAKYGILIFYWM